WETLNNHKLSSSKVTLWRFYFASLIAYRLINEPAFDGNLRKNYQRFLARWGLLRESPSAWQAYRNMSFELSLWGTLKAEFPPKDPLSITEIDYVIHTANSWLIGQGANLWLCLDSLDEVSINGSSHSDIEELLSNLMRAASELLRLSQIKFKLFFRTDLYNALTYVNKDHFSASKLELKWSKEDLAILLAHRIARVKPSHAGRITYPIAIQWINQLFDWSTSKVKDFDDLCVKFMDGNANVLPRNIIQFCIEAQIKQTQYNIQGINLGENGHLISPNAINEALLTTADSKLNDFLQVFQNFSTTYSLLKGHHTAQFTRSELATALNISDPLKAQLSISDLVRVGAIAIKDRKAVNQSNAFEIPYLYALALQIGD
ncbi:MAG: hypothetical protein KIH69_010060, partial [Anaerolineae bacterium]|nr:hypothetical protein [Anaerolineae bacterium]